VVPGLGEKRSSMKHRSILRVLLAAASLLALLAFAGVASAAKSGGTLRINLQSDTDYTDPALAYYQISWQFESQTCVKLINYADKAAPEGAKLIPEAASGLPVVSNGGKTYTFNVPPGKFKFSPPSNQGVTANTFKQTMYRLLNPAMQSPAAAGGFFNDIAGADDYINGKSKSISGIKVKGSKFSITLTKPGADFISRMAMPFTCAVPTNTKIDPNGLPTVSGAGPYYLASYTPKRQIVLKRNPNYHGTRAHNFSQIVYTVGVSEDATLLQVKANQADYAGDGVPPTSYADLWNAYGPNSKVGKAHKAQFFVNSILATRYLALNTSRPAFSNVNLRKAVNFAIDRKTMLQQRGAYAGKLSDQILPPGVAGYKKVNAYPLNGPDVAKAQQFVNAGNGKGKTVTYYTCDTGSCPKRAAILQANLGAVGINVNVQQFKRSVQFVKEGTRGEPFDIADEGWLADYADPFDFINVLLDGSNLQDSGNNNYAYFTDPKYLKLMKAAAQKSGSARATAYASLDANLTKNAVPWAAELNDNNRDFFSAKVGCQLYQPIYGMDLGALCPR
jgi:peptide/nickel transport system substrate-binding protein